MQRTLNNKAKQLGGMGPSWLYPLRVETIAKKSTCESLQHTEHFGAGCLFQSAVTFGLADVVGLALALLMLVCWG